MRNKIVFIVIASIVVLSTFGCGRDRSQSVQDQNKTNTRQVAANKANDTNGLMQADTDSTQTLSTTNSNSNPNVNR